MVCAVEGEGGARAEALITTEAAYSLVPGSVVEEVGVWPAGVRVVGGVARTVHLVDVVVEGADGYRYRMHRVAALRDDRGQHLVLGSATVGVSAAVPPPADSA